MRLINLMLLACALASCMLWAGASAQKVDLHRESVLVDLPLREGYSLGGRVHFVITDGSSPAFNSRISRAQRWRVEDAPILQDAPAAATSPLYAFTNGVNSKGISLRAAAACARCHSRCCCCLQVRGKGIYGYQADVFVSHPGAMALPAAGAMANKPYTALTRVQNVTWKKPAGAQVLTSAAAVMAAQRAGRLTITSGNVVLNTPHIVWPGGQIPLRRGAVGRGAPYGGGQVTKIDTTAGKVTFIAHRGFGPKGQTIYYIVTDATPRGPADMMGVVYSRALEATHNTDIAPKIWQFANGLVGSGPLGFQPGIGQVAPGDKGYSPIWQIYMVSHKDLKVAGLLMTAADVAHLAASGAGTAMEARPGNADHIVNCPFIDPFQNA